MIIVQQVKHIFMTVRLLRTYAAASSVVVGVGVGGFAHKKHRNKGRRNLSKFEAIFHHNPDKNKLIKVNLSATRCQEYFEPSTFDFGRPYHHIFPTYKYVSENVNSFHHKTSVIY